MGKLVIVANGHLSFDIGEVSNREVFNKMISLADILRNEYDFVTQKPMVGMDGTYLDVYKGNTRINIGWDIWSGVFAMSFSNEGDEYIRMLYERLDGAKNL